MSLSRLWAIVGAMPPRLIFCGDNCPHCPPPPPPRFRCLCQRPILLPKAWQIFTKAYLPPATTTNQLQLEASDSIIKITSQWLLHQLILYLQAHLSYRCIHRKFGTILYRTGGDLLTRLSWALGSPKVPATEHLEYTDGGLDINTAHIILPLSTYPQTLFAHCRFCKAMMFIPIFNNRVLTELYSNRTKSTVPLTSAGVGAAVS